MTDYERKDSGTELGAGGKVDTSAPQEEPGKLVEAEEEESGDHPTRTEGGKHALPEAEAF